MTAVAVALMLALGAPQAVLGRGPRVVLADPTDPPVGFYSLPLPDTAVTRAGLRAPHHDYPASDLMVPSGTPVFAAHAGRVSVHDGERCGLGVSVAGDDGRRYVYCHLSVVSVAHAERVRAGDVLGLSGDTGNARGVPHLHFHILDRWGRYLCPQDLLLSWYEGRSPHSMAWRITEGCFFPRG